MLPLFQYQLYLGLTDGCKSPAHSQGGASTANGSLDSAASAAEVSVSAPSANSKLDTAAEPIFVPLNWRLADEDAQGALAAVEESGTQLEGEAARLSEKRCRANIFCKAGLKEASGRAQASVATLLAASIEDGHFAGRLNSLLDDICHHSKTISKNFQEHEKKLIQAVTAVQALGECAATLKKRYQLLTDQTAAVVAAALDKKTKWGQAALFTNQCAQAELEMYGCETAATAARKRLEEAEAAAEKQVRVFITARVWLFGCA